MADYRQIELLARALLRRPSDGAVLLCRNVPKGYHYLPGGHIEFDEPAPCALVREFLEETGLTLNAGPLLAVAEVRFRAHEASHHEINLVFHVEHPPADTLEVRAQEAGIAFDWVLPEHIPSLDLRPERLKTWLLSRLSQPLTLPPLPPAHPAYVSPPPVDWLQDH